MRWYDYVILLVIGVFAIGLSAIIAGTIYLSFASLAVAFFALGVVYGGTRKDWD